MYTRAHKVPVLAGWDYILAAAAAAAAATATTGMGCWFYRCNKGKALWGRDHLFRLRVWLLAGTLPPHLPVFPATPSACAFL